MSKKELIKRYKSDRKYVLSKLDRFSEYITSCDEFTNKAGIRERFDKCELLWDEFNKLQLELEFLEDQSADPDREIFEDKYFQTICKFKELINNDNSNNANLSQVSSVSSAVKLPALDLPVFNGKYDNWSNFFDTFVALIHSNTNLSEVQKFYYLQSCLKGEAAQVISSIPVTELNYEIAFRLLRERYENRRLIIQSHIKSLYDMPLVTKNNYVDLRKFLDTIQKNVRALKSLKEPVQYWDTILIYLFNQKLDLTSKSEWETFSIKNNATSYDEFIKFLTERCQVLESVHSDVKVSSHFSEKVAQRAPRNYSRNFLLNNEQCLICHNGEHWFSNCSKFLSFPESQRINEIKKLRLCLNCFKPNHLSTKCTLNGCKKCGKPHHHLLHVDFSKFSSNNNQEIRRSENPSQANSSSAVADISTNHLTINEIPLRQNETVSEFCTVKTSISAHSANNYQESEILLSTAKVLVYDKKGDPHEVRALLDCGSQSNFISSELVSQLNLETSEVNMSVIGVNSSVSKSSETLELKVQSKFTSFSVNLKFFVLNKIANNLPLRFVNKNNLKIPSNIFLADYNFNIPGSVDLLLGANIFYDLLLVGQIRTAENMPVLQKTKLGWIISGNVSLNNPENKVLNKSKGTEGSCMQTICSFSSNASIQKQMEQFWKLDELHPTKIYKKEEQECEDLFVRTTTHADDGKFLVELPTNNGIENIGDSQEMALKRFYKLEKKLATNENIKKEYSDFMTEYEKLGHMTLIPENEIENKNPTYYMPHHPVIKETSSTTKLRVVFDASARTSNNVSLNEMLKCGPVIQDELYAILLRFREHNYVIGADIEKMYRQVWIKPDQRDLQRIIWRETPNEKIKYFKLNTVTYGTTPASFLAIRSLHMAADEEQDKFPEACREIKRSFYVDDLLVGTATIEEAIKLKNEISIVLSKSGFILRKWITNNKLILEQEEESASVKHYLVEDKMSKILGIAWNTENDSLQYLVNLESDVKTTKRNILSIISRIFDPLGLIGPIIIKAKIIMQKLWTENLGWDEPVSETLLSLWIQFCNELPTVNNINIARHVISPHPILTELHGFSDASERAYGACVYLRSVDRNGEIKSFLLCAKSKVAPLKTLTLPRLELCGALLLTRLVNKVIESLSFSVNKMYYWTDSKIVLSWLSAEAANWSVFVAHRVAEIQQNSNINNWSHIDTTNNPADLISRGCTPEKLICSNLWWHGPYWLNKKREDWPDGSTIFSDLDVPERRTTRQLCAVIQLDQDIFLKFSSLMKLQRVVAFCLRFYRNVTCNKINKVFGNLEVYELEQSLNCLIKISQYSSFPSEIHALKINKPIHRGSKILALNPYLDDNNMLRVGGRLNKSLASYSQKHPAIIDNKHVLSRLIIQYEHKHNLHMGPQNLLSNLRNKFWILGGINSVKKMLRSCIICFKVKPKVVTTVMGELPEQRVVPARPFTNTGVDYAGPFIIKSSSLRNAKKLKAYLCLFVCFVTKAVHLEVVSDMTTESFLNALKRFIGRRGKCLNIFSDCGTNFVGARHEMSEFLNFLQNSNVKNNVFKYLSQEGIKWNFIPPRSPHFGGLWESHVKLAKYHMKRIVGNACLTFEEASTIFVQIEACMNSRPLSPLSNDPSDLTPLTPGHFLIGESLLALPESDVRDIKCSRLSRYQYLKQIVQHFWDRWYRECFSELNKRAKWRYQHDSIVKVGDMVVLKEENLPPLQWAMGRIEQVFPGSDKIVRVVLVKTAKGCVKRAVSKICILPLET